MTSFPPAPETPPENKVGVSLADERYARLRQLLQNERVLFALLTLVLTAIITRTLWFARETPGERALSALYENSQEALLLTKSAFSSDLIFAASPSNHPNFNPPKNVHSSKDSNSSATFKFSTPFSAMGAQSAIAGWQRLSGSTMARAAEWRRLGIVLALFHKPGSLEALAHIGDKFGPLSGVTSPGQKRRISLRARLQQSAQEADPFGHGRVTVPAATEMAMWRALYGQESLSAAQIPLLRQTLLQLRLGWFENIALAQLYEKAGRPDEAREAAQAADISVQQVRLQEKIRYYSLTYGFLGGVILGILSFISWTHKGEQPNAFETRTNTAPAQSPLHFLAITPLPRQNLPFQDLPFKPLLLTFVFYLVCHMTLGLGLSFLLRPFYSTLNGWTGSALLRLEMLLQLGLYIPTFVLPLLLLRSRLTLDILTGEEISPGWMSFERMSLRTLLKRLGYHTHNILIEGWTGICGYLLMTPVLLLGGLLSQFLFHRFHTPVNPAQFESVAAQFTLDKALVFLLAAVAAPIVEETMFRGLLYSALRARFGVAIGAMLSAAVFAGVHPTLPGGFLPIWVIGVALALVYERRGSLLPGIILHGIHNGLITLMGFAIFSK